MRFDQTLKILPESFDALKQKPKQLFFLGDESFLQKRKVAIVGSRRASAYTRHLVSSLSSSLAKRDVYVVSGGAMGVDGIAHKGAYPKTICVLGNSLDIIYPKVNENLIKNMRSNSLLLSEYEPGTKASPWSFVQRNRIVVALSEAVIIAQADLKSGSMHSARIAKELGKPIYVLPQRLGESDGTNALLGDGSAKLINDIEVFCSQFGEAEKNDEVLEFCLKHPSLEQCLARFGDLIYEYELDGRLSIDGISVRVL